MIRTSNLVVPPRVLITTNSQQTVIAGLAPVDFCQSIRSRTLKLMGLSPKRLGSVSYAAVMFGVVSVLAGLLVAALVVPFAALAGTTSTAAAKGVDALPAELSTPPQFERSKVLMGDGKLLATFFDENRVYVPLNKIAPVMQDAQIAVEDHRFYEHGALDVKATMRALVRNSSGGSTQGGSSLTQQYVKMVLIEQAVAEGDTDGVEAAREVSYGRKIQELRYAIALEKKFTKDQILERYLNIAYYGDGAYGVESAAHHYFDTTAAKLTLAQAALLAGLVQNPVATNPVDNPRLAIERRNVVLNRMVTVKKTTKDEADKAKAVEFNDKLVQRTRNGCVGSQLPFLCDFVRRTLLQTPSLGKTAKDREDRLNRGGLTIRTKIDAKTQKKSEKAIGKLVYPRDPVISVMSMIEPGTGKIIAMAQSRPEMGSGKGETYYNYAVGRDLGGAEGYQAGSTFKAFTAAAAIKKGIPLSKTYKAPKQISFRGQSFQTCDGYAPIDPNYKPKNSTISGTMDMRKATAYSVNTYFLQLARDTGNCDVAKMVQAAGVKLADGGDVAKEYGAIFSLTLGSIEVTPISMAEAYATFAARGIHCKPVIIDKITTKQNRELKAPSADCKRVMPKDVADGVSTLLRGVMSATGRPAALYNGHNVAGKTGTTDSNQAVWFTGYTPEVAGAAMIAIDKTNKYYKTHRKSLKGMALPKSGRYLSGSGGGDAGQYIWKPAMTQALKGKKKTNFKQFDGIKQTGKLVNVPKVYGLSSEKARQKLEKKGFSVLSQQIYSSSAVGAYLGISPTGKARENSVITMYFSLGPKPLPPKPKATAKPAPKKTEKKAEKKKADKKKAESKKPKSSPTKKKKN